MVVSSAALASNALSTTRPADVVAVVGDNGTAPYTTGIYYLEFRAHGVIVPPYRIAAPRISARSVEDTKAFMMRLYAGSYHLDEGGSSTPLAGSYDPSNAHFVHVELNMDTKKFAVCIDNEVVASDQPILEGDFSNLHSLSIVAPQTITEAFTSEYVIDDIRITK